MNKRLCSSLMIIAMFLSGTPVGSGTKVLANDMELSPLQYFEEEVIIVDEETECGKQWKGEGRSGVSARAVSINGYKGEYGYRRLELLQQKNVYRMIEREAERFHASNDDVITYTNASGSLSYYAIEVPLGGMIHASEVGTVIVSLLYDHPEFFWSKGYSYFVRSSDYMVTKITLQCQEEYYDGEVRGKKREQFQSEIEQYLDLIVGVQDDYQREKILHDALAEKITYAYKTGTTVPEDARWAHTIEGVFSDEYYSAVCEGYAKAFHLLLNAAGIESVYVVGKSRGIGHAWNQVKIDGEWYNIDVTWNDTGNAKNYKYFNVPDSAFSTSHTPFSITNKPTVGEWCYDVNECKSTASTYSNRGEVAIEENISVVKIQDSPYCDLKVYNKGIEVRNEDKVVSGCAMDVAILPLTGQEHLQLTIRLGKQQEIYTGIIPENGLHYKYIVGEDNEICVDAIPIEMKIRLNDTSLIMYGIDKETQLCAALYPTGAQGEIFWKSSNDKVVIAENGKLHSKSIGTATITAYTKDGRLKESCKVTVKEPYVEISTKKTTIKVGKTIKFKGKGYGAEGKIKWSVSNTKKAKIEKNTGIFKAKKAGTVNVIAKIGKITAKKKITIKK